MRRRDATAILRTSSSRSGSSNSTATSAEVSSPSGRHAVLVVGEDLLLRPIVEQPKSCATEGDGVELVSETLPASTTSYSLEALSQSSGHGGGETLARRLGQLPSKTVGLWVPDAERHGRSMPSVEEFTSTGFADSFASPLSSSQQLAPRRHTEVRSVASAQKSIQSSKPTPSMHRSSLGQSRRLGHPTTTPEGRYGLLIQVEPKILRRGRPGPQCGPMVPAGNTHVIGNRAHDLVHAPPDSGQLSPRPPALVPDITLARSGEPVCVVARDTVGARCG